jgi:hypothetical protein
VSQLEAISTVRDFSLAEQIVADNFGLWMPPPRGRAPLGELV